MSIQSLRASLALLNTTTNTQVSFNAPSRTIYHQIAQDVMLIQGIHYAVEEALANVGELASNPLLNPRGRSLLRLQQNLIDIARISENIQERTLHNIINHPSTSHAPTDAEEEPPSRPMTKSSRSMPLPTTSVPIPPPCVGGSDEVVAFRSELLTSQSDPEPVEPSPPPENMVPVYQAVLERRHKRKAADEGDDIPEPPAKRPRREPNNSIYVRPVSRQREERTSVFSWARWMLSRAKQ